MRRLYFLGIALFLLYAGMEYDHPKFGIAHPAYFLSYLMLSAALLGGVYYYCITQVWPRIAQGAIKRSPQKGMFTDTTITVKPEHLAIKTPKGEGTLDWGHVREVAESEGYIFLFTGGVNAFIIPKRGFVDDDACESALEAIRNHAE